MKKKILSTLLAAAMVLTSCLPAFAEGEAQTQPVAETSAVVTEETPVQPASETPIEPTVVACEECGQTEGHATTCSKYVAPEAPKCTCEAAEGEAHKEGCPLYVAPEEPETPKCTCEAAEGEAHKEGCPLYVAPEESVQPEAVTCDTCNANPCVCNTIVPMDAEKADDLFNQLMKADTIAQIEEIIVDMTEEDGASFFAAIGEEKTMAFVEHLETLVRATIPEKEVIKNPDTEIITPAVNNTNVAPFGEPVEGKAVKRLLRTLAAPIADEETTPDNGLEVNKEVSGPDENGIYTLTLEAWATGEKTIIDTEEAIPTDIILVLDQSGSMAYDFTVQTYVPFNSTNPEDHYQQQLNSLYVKVGDDYFPVTVNKSVTLTNPKEYSYSSNTSCKRDINHLYHKCSDGIYGKLSCSEGWFLVRIFVYTCEECGEVSFGTAGTLTGWDFSEPGNKDEFYTADSATTTYTFSYVDKDGKTQTYGPKTDVPTDWKFFIDGGTSDSTRLDALKAAVTTFTNNVKDKAVEDGVDHRVAIVGFASPTGNGENSEVLTVNGENSGSVGVSYAELAQDNGKYNDALQDMSTTNGQNMVTAAINALAAQGATRVDLGMEMANKILEKHQVPSGEERNRVIVVFTDGVPTTSNSYSETVANSAISYGTTAKTTYGATVYTVGIFDGADSSKDGNENGNETQKANWFMHRLSSNTKYPQTPSYYLSANNATALNNIFQSISDNIETGGSSSTLGTSAVVKDVITDQFVLPEGANANSIKVYIDGVDSTTGAFNGSPEPFNNAQVAINGKEVSVTNFNFSENWVGSETDANGATTYRGKKLIIEIPIQVRDGFLGGNGVYTNAAGSGVYEDATATEPLEEFVSPTVDVAIKDIAVTAPDMNVYLLSDVTKEQLKAALEVKVGSVTLDMDAENYGLEAWQTAYVEFDNAGTAISDAYNDLVADTTYTVQIKVVPTNKEGTATEKTSGTVSGNIYVFKPEITFKDSQINLGETPNYNEDNFVSVVWKHGTTTAPASMGTAPALTYTYTPLEGNFTQDTPVKVTVAIGGTGVTQYVNFYRDACTFSGCTHTDKMNVSASDNNRVNFVVHIATFDLTIKKALAEGTTAPEDQTFVFTVTGQNNFKMEVVIPQFGSVTIKDLPVGTYTITENTAWSWRYNLTDANGKTVSPTTVKSGTATVTFTNELKNNNWLSGTAYADNNFTGNFAGVGKK